MKQQYSLVWYRRDLRLEDSAVISAALSSNLPLLFYFNFDNEILDQIENKSDARVTFIYQQLERINSELNKIGSSIIVKYGNAIECLQSVFVKYSIAKVFIGKDYEPFAIKRDESINEICTKNGIEFNAIKDQVIFEEKEITKKDGNPYTVYTPYMKKWKEKFFQKPILPYQYFLSANNVAQISTLQIPSLEEIGFVKSEIEVPNYIISQEMLLNYNDRRNFPALKATSKLGTHLRFGTVGIRTIVQLIGNSSPQFLNEIVWREFFMQILANFPHVEHQSFKSKFEAIEWINDEDDFEKWTKGITGYPIVDAGMRELLATGNMHNRVRMIVASFLCKHLLIDWRWGEVWFANHLLDYDLASNNGNWQWVAGCGCDAAPYFRVFNPIEQQKKFDPNFEYIKKWVPEFGTNAYPKEMIDHKFARTRVLETYKKALNTL